MIKKLHNERFLISSIVNIAILLIGYVLARGGFFVPIISAYYELIGTIFKSLVAFTAKYTGTCNSWVCAIEYFIQVLVILYVVSIFPIILYEVGVVFNSN